jgi:bacteriocin leader peptide (microcyclamide/patellamide family)
MDKKNISPNPQQPVDRVPTGQLPSVLAELSEEAIGSLEALPAAAGPCMCPCACSYDGDDE